MLGGKDIEHVINHFSVRPCEYRALASLIGHGMIKPYLNDKGSRCASP